MKGRRREKKGRREKRRNMYVSGLRDVASFHTIYQNKHVGSIYGSPHVHSHMHSHTCIPHTCIHTYGSFTVSTSSRRQLNPCVLCTSMG